MTDNKFKVIKGGASEKPEKSYKFADAEVTNTRLMGVLGLHIHWKLGRRSVHQMLYFDVEELGLDSVRYCMEPDPLAVDIALRNAFGGLGGEMVPLTEKEARYLANYFIQETLRRGEELPVPAFTLDYLISVPVTLSDEEKSVLNEKLCVQIKTDYGLVNYYLMRLFGKDAEAAAFLQHPDAPAESFGDIAPESQSTFLKNEIQRFTEADGQLSYLSESLIETNGGHSIVFSEIKIKDGKIFSAKKNSSMQISESEASLKLARDEYVLVYGITDEEGLFTTDFEFYALGCTISSYDSGTMYMEFKENNDHVEKSKFNLNEDVDAVYFVTDAGQLLVAVYSLDDVKKISQRIESNIIADEMVILDRYHFDDSILYDFAMSGFDDFSEFIDTIDEF